MARNYGISVLLMFLAASLAPARAAHPCRLAAALALLANTNVHSTLLAGLAAGAWAIDIAVGQWRGRLAPGLRRYLPLGLVLAGGLLAFAFAKPRENTVLTTSHGGFAFADLAYAVRGAVVRPDESFGDLIPDWVRPKLAILVLYGAIVGLAVRPPLLLAALGAQVSLGVFFKVIYPGWYRHQGLYLMFLIALYWVAVESGGFRTVRRIPRLALRSGLYGSLLALVLLDVTRAPGLIHGDITEALSASEAFGEFLAGSSQYRDAVIVAEPAFMMEALAYYVPNRLYLPREGRFGAVVSWTTASRSRLTLGEVLTAARSVAQTMRRPVLIVLQPIDLSAPGEQRYMYGNVFTWSAADIEAFERDTTRVAAFAAASDERYVVYALDAAVEPD